MRATFLDAANSTVVTHVRNSSLTFAALLSLGFGAPASSADSSNGQTLLEDNLILDVRARYETVDETGYDDSATGLMVRTRAGWDFCPACTSGLLIEFENNIHLVGDFDDTVNNNSGYPLIKDPETIELNRLVWTGAFEGVNLKIGRQRFDLNNGRYLHGARFRQNEQTIDAIHLSRPTDIGLEIEYTYIWNFNTIYGNEAIDGTLSSSTHVLNLSHDVEGIGALDVYLVALGMDDEPTTSTNTLGVRLHGSHDISTALSYHYGFEVANQSEGSDNPDSIDFNYALVEQGLTYEGVDFRLKWSRLPGDGTLAFATPRAGLHLFEGYADKFSTTPSNGVEDLWLSASYTFKPANDPSGTDVSVHHHQFRCPHLGEKLGSEFNIVVTRDLSRGFNGMFKFADYSADACSDSLIDSWARDTRKVWFSLSYSY